MTDNVYYKALLDYSILLEGEVTDLRAQNAQMTEEHRKIEELRLEWEGSMPVCSVGLFM